MKIETNILHAKIETRGEEVPRSEWPEGTAHAEGYSQLLVYFTWEVTYRLMLFVEPIRFSSELPDASVRWEEISRRKLDTCKTS